MSSNPSPAYPPAPQFIPTLVTVLEFSQVARLSPKRVYALLHAGFFPKGVVYATGSRSYRIHLQRALEHMESCHRENELIKRENKRGAARSRVRSAWLYR